MNTLVIIRLTHLPIGYDSLRDAARAEGLEALDRLECAFTSGGLDFIEPNAAMFGVFDSERALGVGGVSRDPTRDDPAIGRLRFFYLAPEARFGEADARLFAAIMAFAQPRFKTLRARVVSAYGQRFLHSNGFELSDAAENIYELDLGARIGAGA